MFGHCVLFLCANLTFEHLSPEPDPEAGRKADVAEAQSDPQGMTQEHTKPHSQHTLELFDPYGVFVFILQSLATC